MKKTLRVMGIVSFIALIGIAYTYHFGTTTMQGVWSGVYITSMAAYMMIEDELQKERKRHDRSYEETD